MNIEKLNIRFASNEDVFSFAEQIIDQFESFLGERGVTLPNPDVEEAKEIADNPEEISVIYGVDYFDLEDRILGVVDRWSERRKT